MKKYLFFAAAVAITACTQDTLIDDSRVPETTKDVAIGFATGTNNLTRAENSSATTKKALEKYHQTMRIWGYKNIKNASTSGTSTSTSDPTYTSTPVFNATSETGNNLYASSVATWGANTTSTTNPDPFNKEIDENSFGGGDWVYSPVRYWDKTATNYDFHAAAPDKDFASPSVIIAWVWKQTNADTSVDWDKDAADGKGAGYFTLGTYENSTSTTGEKTLTTAGITLAGESLPINKEVTSQTDDVFGKGTNRDVDLMIAKDVTEYTAFLPTPTATTQRVNFVFDHILSRLNIAVKTTVQKVTNTTTNVTTGVVTLESVKVFNLKNSGAFDESLVSSDNLAKGTADRWVKGTSTYNNGTANVGIGFPNEEVKATTTTAPIGIVISDKIEKDDTKKTPEMLYTDYKYVFQGLIIPQEVVWKQLAIDGSDVDTDEDIYLEIKYNIDGEEFKAVYNLADVFTANIRYTDSKGRLACKTTNDGVYVYVNESGQYYDENGTLLSTIVYTDRTTYKAGNGDILYTNDGKLYTDDTFTTEVIPEAYILFGADGKVVPAMRAEVASTKNADLNQNITFCEGWQNTLKITIDPKAILFDADVYEWVTKEDATVTVD